MRFIALRHAFVRSSVVAFSLFALSAAPAMADGSAAPVAPVPPDAAVLIVESLPGQNATLSDAALQRRINTYATAIASGRYLPGMLANTQGDTRKTHWFQEGAADPRERADWLRKHLRVTALAGTSLVQVSLEGVADPGERRTIVEEVCSSFLEAERAARKNDSLERNDVLNNMRIKIEAALKDVRDVLRTKKVQLSLEGVTGSRLNVKEMELSKIAQEQIEAQLDVSRDKAYQASLDAQKNPDPADIDLMVEKLAPYLNEDLHRLRALELDRDLVTAKLGADNEKSKELATRVEKTRASYQAQLQEAREKARKIRLETAKQELAAAQAKLKALTSRVDGLKEELGDLSNTMVRITQLEAEEAGLVKQQREVKEQIVRNTALAAGATPTDIRWYLHPEEVPAR
jgi:uncharacterized protein involved in exopolysaccharide biosynthesis